MNLDRRAALLPVGVALAAGMLAWWLSGPLWGMAVAVGVWIIVGVAVGFMSMRRWRSRVSFFACITMLVSERGWTAQDLARHSGVSDELAHVLVGPGRVGSVHVGPDNMKLLAAAFYPDDPQRFSREYVMFQQRWSR